MQACRVPIRSPRLASSPTTWIPKRPVFDLVASYDVDWGGGNTAFAVSANFNETEITRRTDRSANPGIDPPVYFLGAEDVYDEENGLPSFRSNITARHSWANDVSATLRLNWYGDYDNAGTDDIADISTIQFYDGKIQTDLDVTWDVNEDFSVTVGGNNIFDELPDIDTGNDPCCGQLYSGVLDWQGPYYYIRGIVRWD